jgi:hypothetical protein
MSTPSIQTLITQAQQVLNLKSTNEIRATLAAVLANANVGTPLNPNLTTQQLWDEFYEIVRQPSDDIMSIVVDQMMRMVFSPPAPGGAGADKQVIFNDGGVLAGDPDLIFNKALNKLVANNIETAAGLLVGTSATITGDLTVDTSTLKVDSTNNAVGIGTAVAPVYSSKLRVEGGVEIHTSQALNIQPGNTNPYEIVNRSAGGFAFYPTGSTLGLTLAPSGDLSLATGNVVMSTSGKGIDFSATPGTGTSELLNDYEEGTFTPTVFGSTVAGIGVYSAQGGFYTKVGNIVTVQVYLIWSALAGATGDLRFGGLPFAASASTNAISAASIGYANNITLTASNVLTIFNSGTNTFVQAYQYPVGGGASTIVPVALSGGIIYSITYRV